MKMRSDCCERAISVIRLAKQGDEQAMESLILPHKALLHALAGRFHCPFVSRDELVQAGYLGLMRAVRGYDETQNTSLITYAVPWILGEIRSVIRHAAQQADVLSLDQRIGDENSASLLESLRSPDDISLGRIDLNLALRRLNTDEQMVICLRYYRDMTQKETANLLRCSQAQVSRLERRAIDRLHEILT